MSEELDVGPRRREAFFNLPGAVVATVALLVVIHLVREYVLTADQDDALLVYLAFIPERYSSDIVPGGVGAAIWSFLTYALLHANFAHLVMNCAWLVPFSTALVRRVGSARFFLILVLGSIGGAAFFLAFHFGERTFMVGASAGVSAVMAAATRFIFTDRVPPGAVAEEGGTPFRPAPPLRALLGNSQFLFFNGIWFVVNLGTGLLGYAGMAIAWEGHIGGFLVGLLLFPLIDPVGERD
jgi:membrane associated rhomboid family serine protease